MEMKWENPFGEKETMIDFPDWVMVSKCRRQTRSSKVKTVHGVTTTVIRIRTSAFRISDES